MDKNNLAALLQLIQITAMIGGGALILLRMGRMMGAFETIGTQQSREITMIKDEIKEIRTVVTHVAVQKVEINSLREEVGYLRKTLDELRHGEGFTLPIHPKPQG